MQEGVKTAVVLIGEGRGPIAQVVEHQLQMLRVLVQHLVGTHLSGIFSSRPRFSPTYITVAFQPFVHPP